MLCAQRHPVSRWSPAAGTHPVCSAAEPCQKLAPHAHSRHRGLLQLVGPPLVAYCRPPDMNSSLCIAGQYCTCSGCWCTTLHMTEHWSLKKGLCGNLWSLALLVCYRWHTICHPCMLVVNGRRSLQWAAHQGALPSSAGKVCSQWPGKPPISQQRVHSRRSCFACIGPLPVPATSALEETGSMHTTTSKSAVAVRQPPSAAVKVP